MAGASANFRLTRVWLGTSISGTITSQQVNVGLVRATARGTATTTLTGLPADPRATASVITGLDTAWSVNPTLAANYNAEWSFNTQAGMDIPMDLPEEYLCDQGTANGWAFVNLDNALPANHKITLAVEWIE